MLSSSQDGLNAKIIRWDFKTPKGGLRDGNGSNNVSAYYNYGQQGYSYAVVLNGRFVGHLDGGKHNYWRTTYNMQPVPYPGYRAKSQIVGAKSVEETNIIGYFNADNNSIYASFGKVYNYTDQKKIRVQITGGSECTDATGYLLILLLK